MDYNVTVEGDSLVPAGYRICSGEIYKWRNDISKSAQKEIKDLDYAFERGM